MWLLLGEGSSGLQYAPRCTTPAFTCSALDHVLGCVPSCQAQQRRLQRRASGARQADIRHNMACSRPYGYVWIDVRDIHVYAQIHQGPVCSRSRGGDGPVDWLQAVRLHRGRDDHAAALRSAIGVITSCPPPDHPPKRSCPDSCHCSLRPMRTGSRNSDAWLPSTGFAAWMCKRSARMRHAPAKPPHDMGCYSDA